MRKLVFILLLVSIFANQTSAQTLLKGIIKDSVGTPLGGSSVLVKGTNAFTLANDKGEFTLALKSPPPYTIQVSSVGFRQQEVILTDLPSDLLAITLAEN